METLKAIIIDDEPKARLLLQGLLSTFCPEITVVAEAKDLPNGVKEIRKHKPDLVFLDIEMPEHSGLELPAFFDEDEIHFSIIFTTAYNQYALQAFKLSAIDYLLKPIEPDELVATVQRFLKKNKNEIVNKHVLKESLKNWDTQHIALPTSNGMKFIDLKDIILFKADNSYTEIYTTSKEKFVASRTLKTFEDALCDNPQFFRCHKSYIVNTAFISDYIKGDGGYLVLKNKENIPISPEKVKDLLALNILIKR